MPNHIKNRIELIGSEEQVKMLVERFSTHYERVPRKTHDNKPIYIHKETGEPGWLNEETGEFRRRKKEGEGFYEVNQIPEGFEPGFEEAWTRFPDFNKIIPMPESLNITSGSVGDTGLSIIRGKSENMFMDLNEVLDRFYKLSMEQRIKCIEEGVKYAKNQLEHGYSTWYGWAVEKWGTKWNAYSCEKESDNVFLFETAWSGVPQLIEKISKEFPEIEILYEYSDEDTGSNCGVYHFKDGLISEEVFESCSREAYELAFKLRPEYKENYILVDGNYQYKDDE